MMCLFSHSSGVDKAIGCYHAAIQVSNNINIFKKLISVSSVYMIPSIYPKKRDLFLFCMAKLTHNF